MDDSIPWIETYRPYKIKDLIIDPMLKNKINKIIEDHEMPHIIITGVPGIGKTSTLMCIARELLGKYLEDGLLELNGSDERGIKAKDTIETFCKKKIGHSKDKHKYHKIVLIDEADNLTQKSQQQINGIISQYEKNTRFAFTCNTSSKILRAIQSRCIIIRYKRLDSDVLKERLEFICNNEKIEYKEDALQEITNISKGDMRKAINFLQNVYNGYNKIHLDHVLTMCDKPQHNLVTEIFSTILKSDLTTSLKHLNVLFDKGYSGSDLIITMLEILKSKYYNKINEAQRIAFMIVLSKYMFKTSHGLDNKYQLMACICEMYLQNKKLN